MAIIVLIPFWQKILTKQGPIYPRSLDQFYIVTYYIKWVKTSGTYSRKELKDRHFDFTIYICL